MTHGTSKLALVLFGLSLTFPTSGESQRMDADEIIPLNTWNYDSLARDGISADRVLYDMAVYDSDGDVIGDAENILFSPDGRVLSLIAEVGGFWDIGDRHVNVPWDEVEMRSEKDGLTIPVTAETVDDYGLYPDEMMTQAEAATTTEQVDDSMTTGQRVWRATELIGDYARLWDSDSYVNYGYVSDIIINDAQIGAVLVMPSGGMRTPGAYGYPYYGSQYGWAPGAPTYDLPYGSQDIESVDSFDYNIFETQ